MNARWYNPSIGRFHTEDSWKGDMRSPQTLNRYAYTMNDPVNYTDPTGYVAVSQNEGSGAPRQDPTKTYHRGAYSFSYQTSRSYYDHLNDELADKWNAIKAKEDKTEADYQLVDSYHRQANRNRDKVAWNGQLQITKVYQSYQVGDPTQQGDSAVFTYRQYFDAYMVYENGWNEQFI